MALKRKEATILMGSQKAKYNNSIIKFLVKFFIIITLAFVSAGCGRQEIEKLRTENEALKSEVASLKQEITKFKETPDYHYQQGVDFLSSQKYEGARREFETVIEKYPTSSLVASAKQRLGKVKRELAKIEAQRIAEEKRRQEEKKYRPRSPREAIEEWKKFRRNEKAYKGTVTTWRFKCEHIFSENLFGYLNPIEQGGWTEYQVSVTGPSPYTYQAACTFGNIIRGFKLPSVKENDWIVVTGRFEYVSSDGVVVLSPIRVKNEGYK